MGGAATFSPVCTVRFDGAAGALRLTAAPNPFRERLMLTVELPADLAGLASGVYFVHLAVPGQPIQHLKVVKE